MVNYNPYYNQPSVYPPYQQYMSQPAAQNNVGIVWVQGEADAKARFVPSGTSALFMDNENSVFYIKTVDNNGVPLPLRVFDFTERTAEQETNPIPDYLSEDALDKRISDLIDKKMSEKKGAKK